MSLLLMFCCVNSEFIYISVAAILVGLAALKSQSYKGSVGCSLNERMHFALPCMLTILFVLQKGVYFICPNNDMDGYISLSFNNRLV